MDHITELHQPAFDLLIHLHSMRCAKRMYYQSNAIVVYTCIYVIHWETPYIIPAGRKLYSSTNMASPKDAERLALCSLKTTQDEICLKRYWDEPRLYDPRYGQRRIADSQKLSIRNLLACSSPCAQGRVQVNKSPILFAFAAAYASAIEHTRTYWRQSSAKCRSPGMAVMTPTRRPYQ